MNHEFPAATLCKLHRSVIGRTPVMLVCFRGKKCRPVFTQIAQQVVKLKSEDLRLPARAWKVKLIGEGADDAGGVFDDTITEMCMVSCLPCLATDLWHSAVLLLENSFYLDI